MTRNRGFQRYPERIDANLEIPNWSLPQMLEHSVEQYRKHEALSFFGHTTTYDELYKAVTAFAAALQEKGIQKGDRVAIMLPNCPQYVISYYGILMAGGIATQVNPMSVERELEHILSDSGSRLVVTLDALYSKVKAVQNETGLEQVIVASFEGGVLELGDDISFADFVHRGATLSFSPVSIDPAEDLALLQYTGGTTGRSKGAMLTHRNLLANALQSYEFFKDTTELGKDRVLTALPLFHVFGMTACMNLGLYVGASLILLPRFKVEEVVETIQREKPTTFPGVPTMYVALTHFPNLETYGLNSIRVCNSGGAPMPVELLRQFEEKTGARIYEGYGLSEAAPTTHCNPVFTERKPGTIGLPFPSTEFKIVDAETGDKEVPNGEIGELVIRGPQVMKGYWNMPEETARTLRDGWLYTGDIAREDEDGYVSIVDRKKDMILASGYNVYPRDVEEVLYEHPAVQEAVVVGVRHDYRGETVKAFVVLKSGVKATTEEIVQYCKENLAPYKVPKQIEFRDELPKSNVGKLLRRALRDEANEQQNLA